MTDDNIVQPYKPPPQWSDTDLANAKAAGRYDLISAALEAGQLSDMLSRRVDPTPRTTPRWSHPIANTDRDLAAAKARVAQHTADTQPKKDQS